uniref:aldo/keto reductase n=1 Tax=Salmonella enterica TaxID=28901 RepID=UPI00398C25F7
MLQATIGWLLAQPALTTVIAGATRPEQIAQNAQAATAWDATDEDIAAIGAIFA